jgi:hypothetical protein
LPHASSEAPLHDAAGVGLAASPTKPELKWVGWAVARPPATVVGSCSKVVECGRVQ